MVFINKTLGILIFLCFYSLQAAQLRENGHWGSWKGMISAPQNYYMCGAQIRFEDSCGGCDDTAGNGFRFIFCNTLSWKDQVTKQYQGVWGSFKPKVMCPQQFFVNGFNARVQSPCGSCDDTSFNGLQLKCKNPYTNQEAQITVWAHVWGGWNGWQMAPPGQFVKGFQVRFQNPCGGCDDTALNGLIMYTEQIATVISASFSYTIPQSYHLHPQVLQQAFVYNNASTSHIKKVTFEETRTISQKWENTESVMHGYTISFSAGVDVLWIDASLDVITTYQTTKSITFGVEQTKTIGSIHEIELKVPPCKMIQAQQMYKKAQISVPYTLNLTFSTGQSQIINGNYQGVVASSFYTNITQTAILNCIVGQQDGDQQQIEDVARGV